MSSGKFIVSKASAGSGKTFMLVKTFITLAFDISDTASTNKEITAALTDRFRHILAITFTNKAAGEMKERIMSELKLMATDATQSAMAQAIIKDNPLRYTLTSEIIQKYAVIVHAAILHNYSDLSVCTIDSFMQRVVRTFAHDLHLPINFDISIQSDEIIQQVVNDMMSLIGCDGEEDLTDMLIAFTEKKMSEGKSLQIEKNIQDLAQQLFKEDVPQYVETLSKLSFEDFKNIIAQLRKANKEIEDGIQSDATLIIADCHAKQLTQDDFPGKSRGIWSKLQRMAKGELPEFSDSSWNQMNRTGTACEPQLQKIRQLAERITDEAPSYHTRKAILKNIYTLAVTTRLNELISQYYKDNEILHLAEFNRRINDVVQNEPAPFIYERLGSKYQNYLIDEFQDTSILQWQNLLPLVDNGVSGGHTSLIVGDAKQAIYRFRQGDASQFVRLPSVPDNPYGHGAIFKSAHTDAPLTTNFRSRENIIRFNNTFFEWASQTYHASHNSIPTVYQGLRQEHTSKSGGFVSVQHVVVTDSRDEELWRSIYQSIVHQVDDCGYSYRDICILTRKNNELSAIASYLRSGNCERKIPIVSTESFLLSNSTTIKTVLAMLQHIQDPSNRIVAAQVLVGLYHLGRIDQDSVNHLSANNGTRKIHLSEILSPYNINFQFTKLSHLPLYDCCEEILRELGIGTEERAYTNAFLNIVAGYCKSHRPEIADFLEWYSQKSNKFSAKTSSDMDAVQLMTIHKAKGLAAPIIIYPIINHRTSANKEIWTHLDQKTRDQLKIQDLPTALVPVSNKQPTLFSAERDQERSEQEMDDLNVLYVALTRPKDKLLIYCESKAKSGNSRTKENTSTGDDYIAMLTQFRQSNNIEALAPIFNNEQDFAIGTDAPKPTEQNTTTHNTTIEVLDQLSFADWSQKISIADQSVKIFESSISQIIEHGNAVHEILSHIRTKDDIDQATQDYCQRQRIHTDLQSRLQQEVRQVVTHPQCEPFFAGDATIKTECNIAFNGHIRRPDRIIFTPNSTLIVDFKTGKELPEHNQQVKEYCDAISQMGHPNVKGFLIYISSSGITVREV